MKLNTVGKSKPIYDGELKAAGRKQYVADMKLPGMLVGKILFSTCAHGRIKCLDTSLAEALPGVYAVVSYKNAPDTAYNSAKRLIEQQVICNEKIFDSQVRFVGDRVAAVAAETEEIAQQAIKLIHVEYEPLPVSLTIEDSLKEDAFPIHEGGNIAGCAEVGEKELSEIFDSCDYVIEDTYTTQPVHHAAIEPHAALADWNPGGKLTVYCPTQNSFAFRIILSEIFGLAYSKIRVVSPGIGGGFGGKLEMTIEPVAALLSKLCRRPVKIVLSRKETIMGTRVRHGSRNHIRTGFSRDGMIQAMDFKIYTNTGAYASSAMNVTGALTHKVFMAYKIKHMHIAAIPVYTNTITAGAMRGYGSPQVYFGMQRQINEIARLLHRDPAEIQMQNMVEPWNKNPATGGALGNPRPRECLEKAMKLIHYPQARLCEKASKEEQGKLATGVGIALGVHGNNCFGAHRDNASPMIKMNEDGSCILYTGSHDMGTDTVGMQMQILSEVTGIPLGKIDVVTADTDTCLWHIGDYSSRGVFVVGAAAKKSAEKLKAELQKEAAGLLGAMPEDILLHDDCAWVKGEPEKKASLREVMIHCQSVSHRELCIYETYEAKRGAASYGVHIAKVQVNRETGDVKILEYAAVHDVGFIINPLMLEGQLEGAVMMGIGYALSEEISYGRDGSPTPLVLKKYGIPRITETPEKLYVDFVADKGGEPEGPYGAKALGECPVVPAAPAVVNAICNALDIEINDLPALPERILQEIQKRDRKEG